MPYYLDAKAEYVEDGDTVLVDAYVYDPDEDTLNPEQVQSGTCTLVYAMNSIRSIEFDRRFGNSDGTFKFLFSHPPVTTNMQVKVDIELIPATSGGTAAILSKQVPVMRGDQPFIPLASTDVTGDDANDELRSKKRLEELL
jgi:hypothetical protein